MVSVASYIKISSILDLGFYVLNVQPSDTDCCLGSLPNAVCRDISDLNGGGESLDVHRQSLKAEAWEIRRNH